MDRLRNVILLGCAAAAAAFCDAGDFQWQRQLAPGQLLEVHGVIGAIHAVGVPGRTATITAHKAGKNSDPAGVTIAVSPFDGGVAICAMYPDDGVSHPNECNAPGKEVYLSANNNDVAVEFTVMVPDGVRLGAFTVNGDIQAMALTADVTASTIFGGITLATTGGAQANTLHGSIVAAMGTVAWNGIRTIGTVDGDIDLTMPADANVTVHASTFFGSVISDFPLKITTSRWGDSTMAEGTLGSDGRALRVSTLKGNIRLHAGPNAMF
jgi:hypothetical protein